MDRLSEAHNVTGDCLVSRRFPMRAEDPPGIYLGRDSVGKNVYLDYWTALEIAQMVGYPPLEVVEQLKEDNDALVAGNAELVDSVEQLAAEHVEAKYIELLEKTKDEILESQERTYRSLRDASKFGSDPDAGRADKLVGGKGSPQSTRGADNSASPGQSASAKRAGSNAP
jgi:hypothetical protein